MRRKIEGQIFDKYRDGVWYTSTGYEVLIDGVLWLEYENSEGDIHHFN